MARISGIELQDNWKLDFALTRLKGLGWSGARSLMERAKFASSMRVKDLTPDDVSKISTLLDDSLIEGDLVRKVKSDVQRLRDIGSYRGMRHSRNLPSRGQRTKTNARTKRGARKTVGAFKKEMLAKMTTPAKEGK
jgi:small subunit ribosomal protein S13